MGWSSGTSLMSGIIEKVSKLNLSSSQKESLYISLIEEFEDFDCDTLDECFGEDENFDKAFISLHPDYGDFLEGDF